MEEVLDIYQILGMLPQRYPIILVDKVLEYEKYKYLVAIKNVTINEPYFMGHFPGRPIMPGVLMLEALAQASLLLWYQSVAPKATQQFQHFFAGIDKARFKQIVIPGDQLRLEISLKAKKRNIWQMYAQATVDGKLACSAELLSAAKEVTSDR